MDSMANVTFLKEEMKSRMPNPRKCSATIQKKDWVRNAVQAATLESRFEPRFKNACFFHQVLSSRGANEFNEW